MTNESRNVYRLPGCSDISTDTNSVVVTRIWSSNGHPVSNPLVVVRIVGIHDQEIIGKKEVK